jgi:acid phosphatase
MFEYSAVKGPLAGLLIGAMASIVVPFSTAQAAEGDEETLRAVSLLFRHGVISPKYNLPKAKAEWPMGFMQLTSIGMKDMYERGQKLRVKYVDQLGLISANYRGSEVYVRASNTDRSLQTAQLLVLGLYPLGTGPDPSVYNAALTPAPAPGQAFTAVPIHSVALQNDKILRPWTGKANCQKYRNYVKSFPKTRLYKSVAKKHRKFLKRIAAATGVNEGKPPARILYEVNNIYEPLSSMVVHGMSLPGGISTEDLQQISALADWNYHYQFLGKEVGRLTGGPFLNEVLNNFDGYAALRKKGRRFFLYSGHQRTLLGVDAALGVEKARSKGDLFVGRVPPLGSHYAFELHEFQPNKFSIRVKFVTDEGEKALQVPGCDSDMCPIETFRKAVSQAIPENWAKECIAG